MVSKIVQIGVTSFMYDPIIPYMMYVMTPMLHMSVLSDRGS